MDKKNVQFKLARIDESGNDISEELISSDQFCEFPFIWYLLTGIVVKSLINGCLPNQNIFN